MLVAARLLQFVAVLLLFGSPLFCLYGLERGASQSSVPAQPPWQRRALLLAAAVALLGAFAWVMAETASVSAEPGDAFSPAALWTILSATRFGRACLARIALLALSIVATLCVARPKALWIVQVILGGTATASFAWTGHGASGVGAGGVSAPGAVHLLGDLLHLLAAGIWIGALVPLAALLQYSIRSGAPAQAQAAQFGLRRFSSLGVGVVAALVLSGAINSWFLIGPSHWRSIFTSGYGIALLVKLGLFGAMLGLAALNRYRRVPALRIALGAQDPIPPALRALRATVLAETALALLVLVAVSLLGTLAPPISGE
ncbi:MAG: copper homeostasis membrane protein CopD [Steroidobacterales bacterium]